jgi:hypothetical protein
LKQGEVNDDREGTNVTSDFDANASNCARRRAVGSNTVSENLQVYKNTGPGTKQVIQNTAGQIVQCFDNSPPFIGGPNTAPKKEGQCF